MKWVAKRGADKLRVHPNLNHVEAHEHIREHYGVYIDERKMFKTIKEARSLVEGSIQLQYAKLWDYSHELTISNEGSTVKINCIPIPRSPPQFHQIYICLDACKQGFKAERVLWWSFACSSGTRCKQYNFCDCICGSKC